MIDSKKKFVEAIEDKHGAEAAQTISELIDKAESLKERTCYKISFKVPDNYIYVSMKDDKEQESINYELAVDGDLSTLRQVKSRVEIKEFEYFFGDEPTEKSIGQFLFKNGKFVKR
jgi:hypothetical protein